MQNVPDIPLIRNELIGKDSRAHLAYEGNHDDAIWGVICKLSMEAIMKILNCISLQVGRALQPSVFYIGDCEKMFKKKIPKTDPVNYLTFFLAFCLISLT